MRGSNFEMTSNWLSQAFGYFFAETLFLVGITWQILVHWPSGDLSGAFQTQYLRGYRGISRSDLRLNAGLTECVKSGNAPNVIPVEIPQDTVGRTNWDH